MLLKGNPRNVFFFFSSCKPTLPSGVNRRLQAMSAGEKETRLEAILTDTTTLCGQIEANAQELKVLLESGEDDGDVNARVFVLEQVRSVGAVRAGVTTVACVASYAHRSKWVAGVSFSVGLSLLLARQMGRGE